MNGKITNSVILYLKRRYACIVPVYDLTGTEKKQTQPLYKYFIFI